MPESPVPLPPVPGGLSDNAAATINHGLSILQYLQPEVANNLIIGAVLIAIIVVGGWLLGAYMYFSRRHQRHAMDMATSNNLAAAAIANQSLAAVDDGSEPGNNITVRNMMTMVDHLITEQGQVLQTLGDSINRNSDVLTSNEESLKSLAETVSDLANKVMLLSDAVPSCTVCPHAPNESKKN